MAGITEQGFQIKTLNELVSEGESALKLAFGENFNLSPDLPDAQINGARAESYALLWELAEIAYKSFDPRAAKGEALESLVAINNIQRQQEAKSMVLLEFGGDSGSDIPAGSRVSTTDGAVTFVTANDVRLNSGFGQTEAFATVAGPLPAEANTVTVIEDPVIGWFTATNPNPAILGRFRETDAELRSRRSRSVARGGASQLDALYAAVSDVQGVSNVVITENDTDEINNNIQPNSILVVVTGGDSQEIVNAIGRTKTPGLRTSGDIRRTYTDEQGWPKFIRYSRPTFTDVYVTVELTKLPSYPASGDTSIKTNLSNFVGGLGSGDTIINSRLYTPVNLVGGHSLNRILVGDSPSPTSTDDFQIPAGSEARLQSNNINVVEV